MKIEYNYVPEVTRATAGTDSVSIRIERTVDGREVFVTAAVSTGTVMETRMSIREWRDFQALIAASPVGRVP